MKKRKTKITTRIKNNIKKAPLASYVVFSIAMVLLYTLVVTIITAVTNIDMSNYYQVYCGIFGGEILMCAVVKVFKIKGDNDEREVDE